MFYTMISVYLFFEQKSRKATTEAVALTICRICAKELSQKCAIIKLFLGELFHQYIQDFLLALGETLCGLALIFELEHYGL